MRSQLLAPKNTLEETQQEQRRWKAWTALPRRLGNSSKFRRCVNLSNATFIQSKFPEIRRDKFEPGKELSMAEFVREAIRRPPPLEEEAKRAMADVQEERY